METLWLLLLTVAIALLWVRVSHAADRENRAAQEPRPPSDYGNRLAIPALRRVYTVGIDLGDSFGAIAAQFFGIAQLPDFPSTIGVQIEEWQTHIVVRSTPAQEDAVNLTIYGRPWSSSTSWILFEKPVDLPHRGDFQGRAKVLLSGRQMLLVLERPEPSTVELEGVKAFAPSLWPVEKKVLLQLELDSTKLHMHRSESVVEPLLGKHYQRSIATSRGTFGNVPWRVSWILIPSAPNYSVKPTSRRLLARRPSRLGYRNLDGVTPAADCGSSA